MKKNDIVCSPVAEDRINSVGFGNFKRLMGGFPADCDHDAIALDKYRSENLDTEGKLKDM